METSIPLLRMMYTGFGFGGPLALHMAGSIVLFIGVVLLVGWAIRYLPAVKLQQIAFWFIGIGLILVLLTLVISLSRVSIRGYGSSGAGVMMQQLELPDSTR